MKITPNLIVPLFLTVLSASQAPKITVQAEGVSFIGKARKGLYEFLGIPYASCDRWSAPATAVYEDTVDALNFGPLGMQKHSHSIPFQQAFNSFLHTEAYEDCLNLNVMTPYLDRSLPVILYIHSGDFFSGGNSENSCDAANLVKETRDVVVVTPNYRLGPAGWSYHPSLDGEVKGNFGILDIIESIRWVGKYIKYFGGDETKVTLMGHAAGGIIATYLLEILARPEYADVGRIINNLIISSANHMMIPLKDSEVAAKNFMQLAKDMHESCPIGGEEETKSKKPFGKLTVEQIVEQMYEYECEDFINHINMPKYRRTFGPVKDGKIVKSHFFDLLKNPKTAWLNVPVLLTSMRDDGAFMAPPSMKENSSVANSKALSTHISKFITNQQSMKKIAALYQNNKLKISKVFGMILTDALFYAPMQFMHHSLMAAGLDVRHVVLGEEASFPYKLVEGSSAKAGLEPLGAFHYSDHILFFKPDPLGDKAEAFKIVENGPVWIRRLFLDFARNGNSGKHVKKFCSQQPNISDPKVAVWIEKRDLPINGHMAGITLPLSS